MPIILAVNGITETYPVKAVTSRHAQDHDAHESPSSDRWVSAAQQAYRQQTDHDQHVKPALLARDLMTSPVHTLTSDKTLYDAWDVMAQKGFHHIPITSLHDILVGMVSDRDLLSHVPHLMIDSSHAQGAHRKLAEVISTRVISATPSTDIREIANIMLNEHIHAVPILDNNRRLVGILSSRDLVRGIATHGPLELWTYPLAQESLVHRENVAAWPIRRLCSSMTFHTIASSTRNRRPVDETLTPR